jgi:DNA-binding NarL/FixJ family response regulator
MINILIVDDHQMLRDGLERAIRRTKLLCNVFGAANGREALALEDIEQYDLIFMDVSMPEMNGVEATKKLIKRYPSLKIIGLSQFEDRHTISQMIAAGAKGYMFKSEGDLNLKKNIFDVLNGKLCFPGVLNKESKLSSNIIEKLNTNTVGEFKFSQREVEILTLLCQGFKTNEIAEKLSITTRTVEWHKGNLMEKINVDTTIALVSFAIKMKLDQ